MPKKILIVGDPDIAPSGLARIKRDVAKRIYSDLKDVFTVATAGCGEVSDDFPWKQFQLHKIDDWIIPELPYVCQKFAGNEELIVFFFWDASRLEWFAKPGTCPDLALKILATDGEDKEVVVWSGRCGRTERKIRSQARQHLYRV